MKIAIIGAGPTGIAAGHELLKQGFSDFTIYEASDGIGGTWYLHSYPGLACDVWAHAYTFTDAPNPNWSAKFVPQPEIQTYLANCASRFGLDDHIQLNTRIDKAKYHDGGEDGSWLLTSSSGETFACNVVINAMGNQHTAQLPDLPGMDSFAGDSWHSTFWNHEVDVRGKRVAVVGSAAAAIQIVPEMAKLASQVTVLQRTPNWILERGNKPYSNFARTLNKLLPFIPRLHRRVMQVLMGFMHEGAQLGHKRMDMLEKMGDDYRESVIVDADLREILKPQSRFGCKRPVISDDFYPALNQDNVQLLGSGASAINEEGLITTDGEQVDADIIIYCTGYKLADLERIEVIGKDGRRLADDMAKAQQAFRGVAVPGYPNFFFGAGPNGVVLSVSYFKSVEANIGYIVRLLAELTSADSSTIEADEQRNQTYNDWLKSQFGLFAWADAACTSYYQNADGTTPFLFPGNYKTFCQQKDGSGLGEYNVN